MKADIQETALGRRSPVVGIRCVVLAWAGHLHRYLISGGVTVVADLSLFWLLTSVFDIWYLYAHFISRSFGGVICFLANRYYTFSRPAAAGIAGTAVRFLALYLVSFLISSVLVYAFVTGAGAGAVFGKFAAECIVFLFNYTVMKYWVMARRRTDV